jgi:CspA family cold shock protein
LASSRPEDGGKGLLVHHGAIQGDGIDPLAEGARVSYDIEQDPNGTGGGQRQADLIEASPRAT